MIDSSSSIAACCSESNSRGFSAGSSPSCTRAIGLPAIASGETWQTEVIVSFADDEQAVANDYTFITFISGTRYVALGGMDDNNCTLPHKVGACATV